MSTIATNPVIDREIAAHPDLLQIENGWRGPKERRPGAIKLAHVREIETIVENPDAEPALPCAAAKTAIIVYGKGIGTNLSVCTDWNCPLHDPSAAAEYAANAAPAISDPPEAETEEEAAERQREYQQRRKEYEKEQERKAEERKQEFQRQQEEYEAERARREKVQNARNATFERILENVPAMFSAAQLRTFLSALINMDSYAFEDVAEHCIGDDEDNQQSTEEVLTSTMATLPDDKLTGFALRLALTGHTAIPREGEFDFLAEAEAVFISPQPKKSDKPKKAKAPIPVNASPEKAKKPAPAASPQKTRKSA